MGKLVELSHIDIGVHFASDKAQAPNPTKKEILRFSRYEERVSELAKDPSKAMFLFSAYHNMTDFWNLKPASDVPKNGSYDMEKSRIQSYQDMLGSRFFLFAGGYLPSYHMLKELMKQRGFTFNTSKTTLLAYGEYFEICVHTWLWQCQRDLELIPGNCKADPKLCLSVFQ